MNSELFTIWSPTSESEHTYRIINICVLYKFLRAQYCCTSSGSPIFSIQESIFFPNSGQMFRVAMKHTGCFRNILSEERRP